MLLKRTLFAIIIVLVVDGAATAQVGEVSKTANPISIIVIQAVDFLLICVLWPWTARSVDLVNIVCSFFALAAAVYIAVPIMETDEDLYPWWINSLGAMFVSLVPTAVASLYSITCLVERVLEHIFGSMDKRGAAAAEARAIAERSQQAATDSTKGFEELEEEEEEEEEETLNGRYLGDGSGGKTRTQAKDAVSVDLVQVQANSSPSRSPSRSPQSRPASAPVLSPQDLASFDGEFPDVTASDPNKREEEMKEKAAEMAMMRREKELARVARASKRVGWTGQKHEFGANSGPAPDPPSAEKEKNGESSFR